MVLYQIISNSTNSGIPIHYPPFNNLIPQYLSNNSLHRDLNIGNINKFAYIY